MNEGSFKMWIKTIQKKGAKVPTRRLEIYTRGQEDPFRFFIGVEVVHIDLIDNSKGSK